MVIDVLAIIGFVWWYRFWKARVEYHTEQGNRTLVIVQKLLFFLVIPVVVFYMYTKVR